MSYMYIPKSTPREVKLREEFEKLDKTIAYKTRVYTKSVDRKHFQ
jgi:hypothetical protein